MIKEPEFDAEEQDEPEQEAPEPDEDDEKAIQKAENDYERRVDEYFAGPPQRAIRSIEPKPQTVLEWLDRARRLGFL